MKRPMYIRYVLSASMILAMVFVSELLNEPEIIFPEIAALVIGAWIMDKQPWNVSKLQFCYLMPLSSTIGILIVRYLSVP